MTDLVVKTSTYKNVVFANNDETPDHIVVDQLFRNGLFESMKVYSVDGKTGALSEIKAKKFKDNVVGETDLFKAIPVMDLLKDDGVGFNKEQARFEFTTNPEGQLYAWVQLIETESAVKFASKRLHPQTMENFFDTYGSRDAKFNNEFFNANVNNSGPLENPSFRSKGGTGKDAIYGITYSLTPDSVKWNNY